MECYRVKVINTSEKALARAVIAECLLVSSPHSDFPLMSPSWTRQLNHSYLDLSLVGSDINADGVQCHIDLAIMFAVVLKVSIVETGSYFSNGNRQPLAGDIYPIGEACTAQRVVIRHTSMVLEKTGSYLSL